MSRYFIEKYLSENKPNSEFLFTQSNTTHMSAPKKYAVIDVTEEKHSFSLYIPHVSKVRGSIPYPQKEFCVFSNSELGAFALMQEHFPEQFGNVLTRDEFSDDMDKEDYDIDTEWTLSRLDPLTTPGFGSR
jgi:hypothetical protein